MEMGQINEIYKSAGDKLDNRYDAVALGQLQTPDG